MGIFQRAVSPFIRILVPRHADVLLPNDDGVRSVRGGMDPDHQDVQSYFSELQGRLRAAPRGRKLVPFDETSILAPSGVGAQWGGRGGPNLPMTRPNMGVGGGSAAPGTHIPPQQPSGGACANASLRDGGTDYGDCPPSPKHCDVMPLPFNTLTDTNFPLTGSVAGTIESAPLHQVKSGRVGAYQPRWLYFVALNQAADFAEFPALLREAAINRNPQLVGASDDDSAFVSTVFDQVGAYPIDDWHPFTNTDPMTLNLGFATFSSNAIDLQFFGMFWGRPYPSIDAAVANYTKAPYYPG